MTETTLAAIAAGLTSGTADGGKSGPAELAREARVGHLLRRGYHLAREQSARLLDDLDITPRQSAALQAIAANGMLSQAEIGESIGMEPANVHGLMDRLAKKGLVASERDPVNRRRARVRLTPEGARIAAGLETIAFQAEELTLARLSPDERHQLIGLLRKLVAR